MANPEQFIGSAERGSEKLSEAAAERQAELLRSPEKGGEQSPEQSREALESARREAHEKAVSVERPSHELATSAPATHRVKPSSNKAARTKAYKDILRHTQSEMTPVERRFSKVIHQPAIEKASTVVGSTVARPNAILFGALFALILSASVYAIAKYYGYTLSGFEAIGSFVLGWVIGMVIDFIRVAIRGR